MATRIGELLSLVMGRAPSGVSEPAENFLALTHGRIPLVLIRNPRARRYLLRLRPDGSARVTIPRGGSIAEGRKFAERNVPWLEKALQGIAVRPVRTREWVVGTTIHFRGELVAIEAGIDSEIRLGTEVIKVKDTATDVRDAVETHLWKLAAVELPPKVLEHAAAQELAVRRVTVRDQKTRWGSCSRRRTISLNWRIIQAPAFVRDYLILHELMHLKQMNHSARFWAEVERACPGYEEAERWLKQHSSLLR